MSAPTIVLVVFLATFDLGMIVLLLVGWLRR